MDILHVVGGILARNGVPSLTESKRILKGIAEFLRARIDDIEGMERASCPARDQRSKKRKRDDDFWLWVAEVKDLLKIAENLLTQVDESSSFLMCAQKRMDVNNLLDTLALYDKKGDMLYTRSVSCEKGPNHGYHLPVKELVGQATLNTLAELERLLQDAKVGRVAIHGREGIGKTFLMKHLHNSVLKWNERFDYVFWVTSPDQFSIKYVQDAVAAVVKCDLAGDVDLNLRATKLSKKFAALGSFVLFLDGVPEGEFSQAQIGIPVPAEASKCKLVVTTSSTLGCRMLDGFATVELNHLSEEEAFQLFMHEANIDMKSVILLNNTPSLLSRKCCGVPRMIVDIASRMWGIDDIHEWRNALFEMGNFEKRTKLSCQELRQLQEVALRRIFFLVLADEGSRGELRLMRRLTGQKSFHRSKSIIQRSLFEVF